MGMQYAGGAGYSPYNGAWQPNTTQLQSALDAYNNVLKQNGYNGQNMGTEFWNSAPIKSAYDTLTKAQADANAGQAYGNQHRGEAPFAFSQAPIYGDSNSTDPFGGLLSSPVLQPALDVVAAGTGNPELIPAINAATTYGATGNLGQAALAGAEGYAGSQALSGLGSAFPETFSGIPGFSGSSSLSDLYNQASNGISNFFTGGTPDVTGFSGAATPDIATNAARDAVSSTASSSAPTLSGYTNATGASSLGGGTAGGFVNATPAGIDSFDPNNIPGNSIFASNPTPSSGFPTDLASATGGSNVNSLANLFSNNQNLINMGGKALLNNLTFSPNTKGYQGIANAATAAGANYQPYLNAGTAANNTLADLYGTNGPAAAQAAQQNWQNTPGYQFTRDQGINALDASAAAHGNLLSGNHLKAVQDYGTGLANQTYQQYLGNLQNQVGTGLNAAQGVGNGNLVAANANANLNQQNANNSNQLYGTLANSFFTGNNAGDLYNGARNLLSSIF
jgi:hypothetical protein